MVLWGTTWWRQASGSAHPAKTVYNTPHVECLLQIIRREEEDQVTPGPGRNEVGGPIMARRLDTFFNANQPNALGRTPVEWSSAVLTIVASRPRPVGYVFTVSLRI